MIDLPKNNDDKNWSLDDVDRLLSRTEKPAKKQDEKIVENFARTMRLADTVNIPTIDIEKQTRVEDVHTKKIDPLRSFAAKEKAEAALGSPASVNAGDIEITSKTAKQRIADIVKEMKKGKKIPAFRVQTRIFRSRLFLIKLMRWRLTKIAADFLKILR